VGQLSLEQATTSATTLDTGATLVASCGLFAPTIRFRDGVFYIICTNASNGEEMKLQNFYITTKDIWSNRWSDPINFDWKGIDPSLYFDDDNRAYVQGCWVLSRTKQPTCTIKQMEIDIKTGTPLSEPIEIWQGFAKYDSEGPHIYKKDGYYYLLIAEGGTFEHHMLSIARSTSIWGPYESYEANPILTADGTDEYIQNTGHGELFEDGNGQWWAAVLGVRRKDAICYPMGRETFLTPVSWPTGGWPEIQQPKMQFSHKASVISNSKDVPCITHQEDRMSDVFIRDKGIDVYSFSPDGLQITMIPSISTITSLSGRVSFLGKRQRALDCVANVIVLINENSVGKRLDAGLAIYKDSFRHAEIFYDHNTSEICFGLHNQLKEDSSRRKIAEGLDAIDLRIQATERMYEFQYRAGKEDGWSQLGSVDTCEMTAHDFTGPMFGVFACGDDGKEESPVTFSTFKITPNAGF
jgi:beta-xylosidase